MSYGYKRKRNDFLTIPDRWLRCPRKSFNLIEGKFLIFKTPLSNQYNDQVPAEYLFPVDFVFSSMKGHDLKLGLWIDLTNTSRFYNKTDVEKYDCKYLKIQCRGFENTPSKTQTDTFNAVCVSFINSEPLKIIGVHCTHGFNRSGFMVVSFLVEQYNWELKAALKKFSEVRPPGIYKKDYLVELYKRYEEDDQVVPEPPPLPDWCFEDNEDFTIPSNDDEDKDDESDEEEDNISKGVESKSGSNEASNINSQVKANNSGTNTSSKSKKIKKLEKRSEFKQKNATFMAGVPGVEPVAELILGTIQRKVQNLCGWKRNDFPGSQPVSMTVTNMSLLSMKPYTVSWKADGVRYLIYIQDRDKVFFVDRNNSVFQVKNLKFPERENLNSHLRETLLDGEMVLDKLNGISIPRYLVYDIIALNNRPIGQEPFFPVRHEVIRKEIVEPRHKAMKLNMINKAEEPISIRVKDFLDVQFTSKFLSDKFHAMLLHEPDGLIFQPAKDPYTPGTFEHLLKWKPASLNTIDFKLKITTEEGVGIVPKKVGELYVGDLSSKYAILENVKNLKDMDNKIIECKFENNKWVFLRERTDKAFPNSYNTAIRVFESIKNPVTQEMLLQYIETSRYTDPMPPPMAPFALPRHKRMRLS